MDKSLLQMDTFSSLDWTPDETGLFADNKRTGERILMERFEDSARRGIIYKSTNGQTMYNHTKNA